jgi:small subunit ribosomal protein S20
MPNKKSVKKALLQSKRNHLANKSIKNTLKTFTNTCLKALSEKEIVLADVKSLFKKVQSTAQKAARKSVIHKNTAARKVSVLSRKIVSKVKNFFS